nr:SPASM domain-containing protein [Streptococcus intermedius]
MLRISKSGKGTFDKIIQNLQVIKEVIPRAHVNINCNLNNQNINHIEELLSYLKSKNILYPVVYSLVIDTQVKKFHSTIHNVEDIWKKVHDLSDKYGYLFSPFYRDTYLCCSLFQKNNYTIGVDGYLYACIEAVGTKKYRQAHVSTYETPYFDYFNSSFMEINNVDKECKTCKFLPVCDGGCLYKKIMQILFVLKHNLNETMYQ